MAIEIPDWLKPLATVVAGQEWPEGNEDLLRALRDAWALAAEQCEEVGADVGTTFSHITGPPGATPWTGEAATAFATAAAKVVDGDDAYFAALARSMRSLSENCGNAANEVEYGKLLIIATLVVTAIFIAWAIASTVATFGTSAAAIVPAQVAARTAIQIIFRQLVQKLVQMGFKGVAVALLKQVAINTGISVAMDAGIQTYQMASGNRAKWDTAKTTDAAIGGAVDGVVSAVSLGIGKGATRGLADSAAGRVADAAARGAVRGGLEGVTTTVGEAAVTGKLDELSAKDVFLGATSGVVGGASDLETGGVTGALRDQRSLALQGDVATAGLVTPTGDPGAGQPSPQGSAPGFSSPGAPAPTSPSTTPSATPSLASPALAGTGTSAPQAFISGSPATSGTEAAAGPLLAQPANAGSPPTAMPGNPTPATPGNTATPAPNVGHPDTAARSGNPATPGSPTPGSPAGTGNQGSHTNPAGRATPDALARPGGPSPLSTPTPAAPSSPAHSNPGPAAGTGNPALPSNPMPGGPSPATPGNLANHSNTSAPANLSTPAALSNPANPNNPATPSNPAALGNPANPNFPAAPSNLNNPANLSTPAALGNSANLNTQAALSTPTNLSTTTNPSNPATPSNPANLGTPAALGNPDSLARPGTPSTLGNPPATPNPGPHGNPAHRAAPDTLTRPGTAASPGNQTPTHPRTSPPAPTTRTNSNGPTDPPAHSTPAPTRHSGNPPAHDTPAPTEHPAGNPPAHNRHSSHPAGGKLDADLGPGATPRAGSAPPLTHPRNAGWGLGTTPESMAAETAAPDGFTWDKGPADLSGLDPELLTHLGTYADGIKPVKAGLALDGPLEHTATIPPDPVRFTVAGHGTPTAMLVGPNEGAWLTAKSVAAVIRTTPGYKPGTPVRLVSCNTGAPNPEGPNFATQLAAELGVEVLAPTTLAWAWTDGSLFASAHDPSKDRIPRPSFPNPGQWVSHRPDGTTAVHDNPFPPGIDHKPALGGQEVVTPDKARDIADLQPRVPLDQPGSLAWTLDGRGIPVRGHVNARGDFVPHHRVDEQTGKRVLLGRAEEGRWVPAHREPDGKIRVDGEFDDQGRWVPDGHYDDTGSWVPTTDPTDTGTPAPPEPDAKPATYGTGWGPTDLTPGHHTEPVAPRTGWGSTDLTPGHHTEPVAPRTAWAPNDPHAPHEFHHPGGPRDGGWHQRPDEYGTSVQGHVHNGRFVPHFTTDAYNHRTWLGEVDDQGRWLPNHLDPDGSRRPNGHHDPQGRWFPHGHTDARGRWVPVRYDGRVFHDTGRWVDQPGRPPRWEPAGTQAGPATPTTPSPPPAADHADHHPGSRPDGLPRLADLMTQQNPVAGFASVVDGEFAGARTAVTDAVTSGTSTTVTGVVRDADGATVGSFTRVFERLPDGGLAVEHTSLTLDAEVQGQGFATLFNESLERWYRANGVDYVHLEANSDVGSYTWARAGYEFMYPREVQASVLPRLQDGITGAGAALAELERELAALPTGPDASLAQQARIIELQQDIPWHRGELTRAKAIERVLATSTTVDAGYPKPREIADLFRPLGAGRHDRWLGKEVLMEIEPAKWNPVSWHGRKWLR